MTDGRDQGIEGADSSAEGAEDLDDAALAAAALGAEADVSTEGPGGSRPTDEDEDEDDLEGDEDEAEEAIPGAVAGTGRAGTAAAPLERHLRPEERRAARLASRTQIPIDPALRITDRASAIFVLACVAIFAIIFVNGVVLGHGGLLTPSRVPSAVPTLAVPSGTTPSGTSGPSGSAAPSGTAVPSAVPSPSPAAS